MKRKEENRSVIEPSCTFFKRTESLEYLSELSFHHARESVSGSALSRIKAVISDSALSSELSSKREIKHTLDITCYVNNLYCVVKNKFIFLNLLSFN
jgi:hypothetical protein